MSKFHVIHIRKKIPYYIHPFIREGTLRFYFFSSSEVDALDRIPEGYEISMNPKTKQPILKKIKN